MRKNSASRGIQAYSIGRTISQIRRALQEGNLREANQLEAKAKGQISEYVAYYRMLYAQPAKGEKVAYFAEMEDV